MSEPRPGDVSRRRHVGSTYRLQLNGIGFAGATALVPFMSDLGVETCYVSPITRARAGSTHGYDVIDPNSLDPSLGSRESFEAFLAALAGHQMGLLVDIVPNHMAASTENAFFADVLRHGRNSEFARYFDIAWHEHDGRLLLPVLGRSLSEALEAGELRLVADGGGSQPAVAYFDQRFPVGPGAADAAAALAGVPRGGELGRQVVESVVARQHYLLADWRLANRAVNYRRFFDINELIGVRQEDPQVFAATHQLVATLSADPRVVGFRVDHVDGLRDPADYLERLRDLTGMGEPAPVIEVEKILANSEELPDWPVEGTTGYEFANLVLGLFVDVNGATEMGQASSAATGDDRTFDERAIAAKRAALESLFPHQLDQVTGHFERALSESGEPSVTSELVRVALRELTTFIDVYRTYRQPGAVARQADIDRILGSADRARAILSADSSNVLDGVLAVLGGSLEAESPRWQAASTWQQLTGPVAAKGVEDTALYDSGRLLATADVGSNPDLPAVSADGFHLAMARRGERGRSALNATSTHDSKRSHDIRCRLAVLSEMAAAWETFVEALDRYAQLESEPGLPDAADRRYVYETLVGAWPVNGSVGDDFGTRILRHLTKVAREAKRHSSWLEPDLAYEAALGSFAQRIILGEPPQCRRLIEAAVLTVERPGVVNSLSATLLKAAAPGVPDTYQGDDRWFLTLVDPDNRGPLAAVTPTNAGVGALLADWRSGAVKQFVLRACLQARRHDPTLFAEGRYLPLDVVGRQRDHVLAFARVHLGRWAIAVVPRLVLSLPAAAAFPIGAEVWADTEIVIPPESPAALTEAFTGEAIVVESGRIAVGSAFDALPVSLLLGGGQAPPGRDRWLSRQRQAIT
jgi:(1->4)-alpha-D-glucan 1-alpha-D-glucosylmutase